MALVDRYEADHDGWYVRHFYGFYRDRGGTRSYSWVKKKLHEHGKVERGRGRGRHRKRREPAPVPGMLLHQDASTHEWVPGEWWDLVVTMDDATNEHHSMFPCDEEGTRSSFLGIRETVEARGLFCSLYTDRASHYWTTPDAGGKVDRANLTQFGRALVTELGIEMIPAYSPEARGRSERAFRTHQGRLPRELALQLPGDRRRPHYMKARVRVRRHMDGHLSVWHGPRLLQGYGADGGPVSESLSEAAWDGRDSGDRHVRSGCPSLVRVGSYMLVVYI